MTPKLPVKDHLRDSALYYPRIEAVPGTEWKCRLLRQHAMQRQVKALLQERTSALRWSLYAVIPGVIIALVFAAYFGFLNPGEWSRSVPAIGMREALLLIAAVNGCFLVAKRRAFAGL